MIGCVECGRRALRAVSEDTWRVFLHDDGEWDDYCPDCAERRLAGVGGDGEVPLAERARRRDRGTRHGVPRLIDPSRKPTQAKGL
jgi:hypothetical protein